MKINIFGRNSGTPTSHLCTKLSTLNVSFLTCGVILGGLFCVFFIVYKYIKRRKMAEKEERENISENIDSGFGASNLITSTPIATVARDNSDSVDNNMATISDVMKMLTLLNTKLDSQAIVTTEMKTELGQTKSELKQDNIELNTKLRQDIQQISTNLEKKISETNDVISNLEFNISKTVSEPEQEVSQLESSLGDKVSSTGSEVGEVGSALSQTNNRVKVVEGAVGDMKIQIQNTNSTLSEKIQGVEQKSNSKLNYLLNEQNTVISGLNDEAVLSSECETNTNVDTSSKIAKCNLSCKSALYSVMPFSDFDVCTQDVVTGTQQAVSELQLAIPTKSIENLMSKNAKCSLSSKSVLYPDAVPFSDFDVCTQYSN